MSAAVSALTSISPRATSEAAIDHAATALEEAAAAGVEFAVVLAADGNDVEVLLFGSLPVELSTATTDLRLRPTSRPGLTRQRVSGPLDQVSLGDVSAPIPWSDLVEGVVPGGGVISDPDGPVQAPPATEWRTDGVTTVEPQPTGQPEGDAEIATDGPRESTVQLSQAQPGAGASKPAPPVPESGPQVYGIACSRGHFNRPGTTMCAWCGTSEMYHQAPRLGERPPIGVIVLDDRSSYPLDADYVIGRQPRRDPRVDGHRVRELVLPPDDRGISRAHASVTLHEWSIYLDDLGSDSGTWVVDPVPGARPRPVTPGQPMEIHPGATIMIGSHHLVLHPHHEA